MAESVQTSIVFGTAGVTQAGFGKVLCVGPATFSERYREYSSYAEASDDSAEMTASQLLAVRAAFSQSPAPQTVAVGKALANAAQVDTATVTSAVDTEVRSVTINGTVFAHTVTTGQTTAQVAAALNSLINAGSEPVTSTVSASTLTLTADVAGTAFTVAVSSGMSTASVTPNRNYATELDLIVDENNDWYGLVIDSRAEKDIDDVFAWSEANKKMFFAQSSDSSIIGASTTDIASDLQDLSYMQGAIMYHADDDERMDAAWLAKGTALPIDPPGKSTTFNHKTLAGITVDTLTSTQIAYVKAKNANYFRTWRGNNVMGEGVTPSGKFIDEVITKDWFTVRLEEDYAQLFISVSNAGSKVPYNDAGFTQLLLVAQNRVLQAELAGHVTPGTAVYTFPKLSAVSSADRSARIYRASFSVQLAGAVHTFIISGTLV